MGQVQRQRAGCDRRIRDVGAQMPGTVIEGAGESRVVARVAAIELEPAIDLVRDVDFVPITAARGARDVRSDIRINGGLGLLPEVVDRDGKGKIALRRRAKSQLLAFLPCEQWRMRKSQIHAGVLISPAQIGAVKPAAGSEIEF